MAVVNLDGAAALQAILGLIGQATGANKWSKTSTGSADLPGGQMVDTFNRTMDHPFWAKLLNPDEVARVNMMNREDEMLKQGTQAKAAEQAGALAGQLESMGWGAVLQNMAAQDARKDQRKQTMLSHRNEMEKLAYGRDSDYLKQTGQNPRNDIQTFAQGDAEAYRTQQALQNGLANLKLGEANYGLAVQANRPPSAAAIDAQTEHYNRRAALGNSVLNANLSGLQMPQPVTLNEGQELRLYNPNTFTSSAIGSNPRERITLDQLTGATGVNPATGGMQSFNQSATNNPALGPSYSVTGKDGKRYIVDPFGNHTPVQ